MDRGSALLNQKYPHKEKMKVALFIPCLNEHFYPQTAISMVKILHRLGIDVEYVDNQTCCGQPAFNTGYRKQVMPVAERFIRLFKDKQYIVAPSGSCVYMVKSHYDLLDIREDLVPVYQELKGKIFEFTEFLVDVLNQTDLGGRFPHRVTYHDSCHLSRGLGIRSQPRLLIKAIKDIDFVEMERSDLCCGFGGTFSYKCKEISVEMVKQKCSYIEKSGARYCIGADCGCLMNISGFLKKHQKKIETMHIADLLAKSLNLG